MLYLKEANLEDIEMEYLFIYGLTKDVWGFMNPGSGCTREEFERLILPGYINHSKGIGIKEGRVPDTAFFLWEGDNLVGLFKLRHYLTEALANGAGHIGYEIAPEYRGRGYATEGLRLTIEKAWEIIPEDEIYMSVRKENPASLRVQVKNGAYVHHEDETHFYTRIKKPEKL